MAANRTGGSAGRSPAARQGITVTLGPDLLSTIFCKLGPSPVHLAAIACVCKDWRNVMQERTWKLLLLDAAPVLYQRMGYNELNGEPLGGWLAAYKVISYCPGLLPSEYENLKEFTKGSEPWPGAEYTETWCDLVGHVEEKTSGFQTGPAVIQSLRLREPFRNDVVFVTSPCVHEHKWSEHEPRACAFRGIIQNFPGSAIAAETGARAFLEATREEQETMQEEAEDCCVYCQAPSFELSEEVFFENDYSYNHPEYPSSDDSDASEVDESEFGPHGFAVKGSVCGNGHLIMGGYGSRHSEIFLHEPVLEGSGEGLQLEQSELMDLLCETFSMKVEKDGSELAFRKSIDPFSASPKLRRLAVRLGPDRMVAGPGDGGDTDCLYKIGEKAQKIAESSPKCKVLVELGLVNERISTVIERFKYGVMSSSESDSDSDLGHITDSESDWESEFDTIAASNYHSFWEVIAEVLRRVQGLPAIGLPLVRSYLGFCNHSASYTLDRIETLESLEKRRILLEKEVVVARKERREEIEAALKAAGVSARCGRRRNQWPDYRAVNSFIRVSRSPQRNS